MFNTVKKYNKHTFFEYAAYGKAVVFDSLHTYRFASRRRMRHLAKLIQDTVLEFAQSNYRINDDRESKLQSSQCVEAVETMFWAPKLYQALLKHRKYKKKSFIDLYDLAVQDVFNDLREGITSTYLNNESIEQAIAFVKSSDGIIKKLIKRVLLQETIGRYNEPIIIITDDFFKEYMYQLSPYVKGFVLRKVSDKDETVEFSFAYEIPMVESQIEIKHGKRIIIDNYKDEIIVKGKRKLYKEKCLWIDQLVFKKDDISNYKMSRIKFYAPLVDTRHIELVTNRSYYAGLAMYRSEYLFMAKGMLPTKEELVSEYTEILKHSRNNETIFRIPDFGEFKILDYMEEAIASITYKETNNIVYILFFEALHDAVKETKVRVDLVAPMLRDSKDIKQWRERIKYLFADLPESCRPKFGVMLETETAVDYIEDYVKTDFNVFGLNDLTEEITYDFSRYDFMPIEDMKEELFVYLQYAHQHMRRTGIRLRHFISGNMLTNRDIFLRLINAGFSNYIVPISNIRLSEELLMNYESSRGRYVGVSKRRRDAKEKKEKERI